MRVDDLALEHVAARVDLVGRRILRLLQERGDHAVRIGRHTTECARITDPDQMQRDVGVVVVMGGEQGAEVGAGQHVAVEHHRGVVPQLRRDVGDAAAGAERLLLDDVVDLQAELRSVTELGLEHLRLVGRAEHDVLDARRGDPRQQVGQERQTGGRQHRLGRRQRQRPQPGALPADEDDGVHAPWVNGIRHATAVPSPSADCV